MMRTTVGFVSLLLLGVGAQQARADANKTTPVAAPAAPSAPTPKPAPKPTEEQLIKYRAALKEGRALAGKNDHAGAAVAFRRALVEVPEDAPALSELGLALLAARDLVQAEQVTRRAVAAASGNLKAASLYNLGLVLEEKGDKAGAVEAFKQSLAARQNKVVYRRLAKLDPAAAAASIPPDTVEVAPMQGPLPNLATFAKKESPESDCDIEKGKEVIRIKPVASPYLEARIFPIGQGCSFDGYGEDLRYFLAVRLSDGWYVSAKEIAEFNHSLFFDRKIKYLETVFRDVIVGGVPEIVVRYRVNYSNLYRHGASALDPKLDEEWESEELILASIGASGKPSNMTIPLVLNSRETAPKKQPKKPAMIPTYLPNGVELAGKKYIVTFP